MNSDHLPTLVPNRIDRDPAIIRGVTAPELYLLIFISIPLGIFSAIFFGALLASFFVGLSLGMIVIVLTIVVGVYVLANIKRNKPNNYLTHAWHVKRENLGLGIAPFIHKTTRYKGRR